MVVVVVVVVVVVDNDGNVVFAARSANWKRS